MRFILSPIVHLAALFVLFESWFWARVGPLLTRLGALLPFERAKVRLRAFIEALSPRATLVVFLLPALLVIPVKLVAVDLLAGGRPALGLAVLIAAKFAGVGLEAFLFEACKPKLMQIERFARLHWLWIGWRDWAHAHIARVKRRLRARLALALRGRRHARG